MKTFNSKIIVSIGLFLLNASIFPADFFTQDMIEFKTVDNQSVSVPRDHYLLKNFDPSQLGEANTIKVPFRYDVVKEIFSENNNDINDLLINIYVNKTATDVPLNYTYVPLAINKLFSTFNIPKPITQLADLPFIDNIALQNIARIWTKQDWKPGYNPALLRKSLIAERLGKIKQQYGNDKEEYKTAMQPYRQALYNTLHYLTDLNTQTKESLEIAKMIINNNELSNYFILGGGSYIDYMLINLQLGNKENNQQFLNKLENHLQGLLQTSVN